MRLIPILIAAALAIGPVAAVRADDKPADPPKPAEAQKTAPSYILAADDVISITVVGHPDLSMSMIIVPSDGIINFQLLEPVNTLGKTTQELADVLTTRWRKFLVNPTVNVSLLQKRKESVLVYGAVARAGNVEYKPQLRLIEAIGTCGGVSPIADLIHVSLARKSGEKKTLDLSKLETKAGTAADVILEVGDVVFIPERKLIISVLGEVNKPGSYDYRDEMTIVELMTLAGGPKPDSADLKGASLLHDGKETRIDLDAMLNKGDLVQNVKLSANDRIIVPEIRNRTYVFGAVGRAGFYNFKEGDRLLDALTNVGGPTREADLGKINVVHVLPDKTAKSKEEVNLNKFLRDKKPDLKNNIALSAGDIVFVPERKKGFNLADALGILTPLGLLRNAVGLFTGGR